MAPIVERVHPIGIHPLHAVLLAGTVPLFIGAVLGDWAYAETYQVQWTNFAAWLIAGGLLLGGVALAWAIVDLFRGGRRGGRRLVYVLVLLATWVLGFVNALVHAKDAWATMPEGLVLSVIVAVLACVATWLGYASLRTGDTP